MADEEDKFTVHVLIGWHASGGRMTNDVILELRYYVGSQEPTTDEELQTHSRSLRVRMSAARADEVGMVLRKSAATILHPSGTKQ